MEQGLVYLLWTHIAFGALSLITGAMGLLSAKGKRLHRKAGKIYFLAMTVVFITGSILASASFNRFLFLIAFISYYSVFTGVRILRLKQLHKGQQPRWYDWAAGIITGIANLAFVGLGLYYWVLNGALYGGTMLSIGFGLGGLALSYVNLKPFIKRPKEAYHWYLSHMGNMAGGYIATFSAFLSTTAGRHDWIDPVLSFALPSLIGVPLLIFWQRKMERKLAIESAVRR